MIASLSIPAVLLLLVWRWPRLALYVLIGCAVGFEIFPLKFPDSMTDDSLFFLNLNNTAGLPVSASPADLALLVGMLGWWRAQAADPTLRPSGPMLKAYLVYLAALAMAEIHGLLSHGDFNITLWELRPQMYGFATFVMAASLVRERRHLVLLASVFLSVAAFKVGVGYNRYFNTLHGDLGYAEAILAHEDSYFLSLLIVAGVTALVWYRRRRLVIALLLLAPVAALVLLENRRRVGVLALGAALVVIAVLAIRYEASLRTKIVTVSVVAALAYAGFLAAYWNHEYGVASQLVRPIHSLFEPDQRDFNSNLYRENEDANLAFTFHTSPIIGVGFGVPMEVVFPLADISQQYPFWQYIPHNTILWVAMRMGLVGCMAFWALIGISLLQATRSLRVIASPFVRGCVAFAVAAIIAELIVAYGDVQLENYRNLIFIGAALGLINAAEKIKESVPGRAPDWARVPDPPRSPMGSRTSPSYTPSRARP